MLHSLVEHTFQQHPSTPEEEGGSGGGRRWGRETVGEGDGGGGRRCGRETVGVGVGEGDGGGEESLSNHVDMIFSIKQSMVHSLLQRL